MKNTTFSKVHRAFSWFIDHRMMLIALILLATAGMGYMASKVEVKTIFSDLLPKTHPYVKVNQQFKSTFGGSNLVTIMVENQKGEIFDLKVLEAVQKLTVGMQQVNGIDTYQIISLASKKIKEIRASTEGVESKPIMWPRLPEGPEQMAKLRAAVLNNPLVYGPYVSLDLKATLITADFRDGEIDYTKAFNEIMAQIEEVKKGADGVTIRVVGEPVLYGWVNFYLDETIKIFFGAICSLFIILLVITRTWHGTFLPLVAGAISAIWALGAAKLMGFHLDPLVIVVAFLITAQAVSNSVQLISRYDDEIAAGAKTSKEAAVASAENLFKPSMLAIVADAGCVVAPVPPVLWRAAGVCQLGGGSEAVPAVSGPGRAAHRLRPAGRVPAPRAQQRARVHMCVCTGSARLLAGSCSAYVPRLVTTKRALCSLSPLMYYRLSC